MAKTIKFNLICDEVPVRTIEDLQNHFSIEDVLEYYRNGLLCRWLKVRGYDEQLKKVEAIKSEDSMEIIKELISIFEISCDMEEIEKNIYILKYKKERELENSAYKAEGYCVDTIIDDYRVGYNILVDAIFDNPDNVAKIKAVIQEIVDKYEWVLRYNYRRLLTDLVNQKMPLAVMCFLMNEKARDICFFQRTRFTTAPKVFSFPAWSDNAILYDSICKMIQDTKTMSVLGNELKSFAGVTDGYWKDLKPKGKKYMLISMGEGDFVRAAGVNGGDMRASDVNNKFVIVDGIDYKSNSTYRKLLYMEV